MRLAQKISKGLWNSMMTMTLIILMTLTIFGKRAFLCHLIPSILRKITSNVKS